MKKFSETHKRILVAFSIGFFSSVLMFSLIGGTLTPPGYEVNQWNSGLKNHRETEENISEKILKTRKATIDDHKTSLKELGFTSKDHTEVPRAWSVAQWGESQEIEWNAPTQNELNKILKTKFNFKAPENPSMHYTDHTWQFDKGTSGKSVKVDDFRNGINTEVNSQSVGPDVSNGTAEKEFNKILSKLQEAELRNDGTRLAKIESVQLNSMIDVTFTKEGSEIKVNESKVKAYAKEITPTLNRKVNDGEAVVDADGKILKKINKWNDGFHVSEKEVTEALTNSLEQGIFKIEVSGERTAAHVDKKFRKAIVDKSDRRVYLYENDVKVHDFPVAIGKPGTETDSGQFKVQSQLPLQDMGCNDDKYDYCTKNVPWISYYNGDEALHGAYWHEDFGNPDSSMVSHGCVNMPISNAKASYEFLQVGSPVEVRE